MSDARAEHPDSWLAGAAVEVFTPPEPLWLAGYASRTAPARGVLSDLTASAVALRDPAGRRLLLAAADIIAIPAAVADAAADLVRARRPELTRDQFVFAASHTHYAPEVRLDKASFFRIPPEFAAHIPAAADLLRDALARAILRALDDLGPVQIFARRAAGAFAHNRRAHGDMHDPDVPFLELRRPDGSIKSLVFSYACHNTTLEPADLRYSSDWTGHAREALRAAHPSCTPLFLAGCGADQNPDPRGTPELSLQHGQSLAAAILDALDGQPIAEVAPSLASAFTRVEAEMEAISPEWLAEALASSDPPRRFKAQWVQERLSHGQPLPRTYPLPLQAVRLGREVLMLVLPGEPVIDWAFKLKREYASFPLVIPAGYCNDMPGYLPTARVQNEGGYEGGRASLWSVLSPWTSTLEPTVTTALQKLASQVMAE